MSNLDDDKMTIQQFIDRYYKAERLNSEPGRRERIIADRENDLREHGEAIIGRYESVTGQRVVLFDPNWRPVKYIRWLVSN